MKTKPEDIPELLPLRCYTPIDWAEHALQDIPALLSDHAHLEKKATTNALGLLHRWPEHFPDRSSYWTKVLAEIAKDEILHLNLVLQHLDRMGAVFTRSHENSYAGDLRMLERHGSHPSDLIDRLLICSLIEARSCERFCLLAHSTEDVSLRKLYSGLWSSEHNHYLVFLELAAIVCSETEVKERWSEMLDGEAEIIQRQSAGPRIHSWLV
jgi:tRNA-(ms[2]io[6]A)-hydroxylase